MLPLASMPNDVASQLTLAATIIGAVVALLAALVGLVKAIGELLGLIEKKNATALVKNHAGLSSDEKSVILRALGTRLLAIIALVVVICAEIVLAYFAYSYLVPERKPLPKDFSFQTVQQISISTDPWLAENPLFLSHITSLIPEKRETRGYSVLRADTKQFKNATSGNPTISMKARVTVTEGTHQLTSPMVLLVHDGSDGKSYESVAIRQEGGTVHFTIPPSDPDTSLLILGGLQGPDGKDAPKLDKVLKLEVSENEK
jgi:hypothetical protein